MNKPTGPGGLPPKRPPRPWILAAIAALAAAVGVTLVSAWPFFARMSGG